MEMRLSQADAVRRLNVSRSVVQRLWDKYQSENSVSKRRFRPTTSYNTCRRPFSSSFGPKEKNHYCAAALCRPLCSNREKNLRYYGATSCVCSPQRTTEKGPLMLGKRTRFLDQTAMGFCTLYRRVQIHTAERFRASADLEGTMYQIPSQRTHITEVVESWLGQGPHSVVTLTCMYSMEEL
ncbi:hypothetical protein AVEN_194558-1 [Araneus ventricosus]|uniref:Transposase Tc1-like domain-containing protein n=1 Tax=Araneus ventricosus TaxID=182803 RepID=A0A4Y2A717_ARAVE|nr:hypothetical protein AVEN_194558-1 [Araneus ventricosus]